MSEPTMRDITHAAAFITAECRPAFSPVEATHALSWLIAKLRDEEREACAKTAELVPVADRNPALVRNEIADKIRMRLSPSESNGHE